MPSYAVDDASAGGKLSLPQLRMGYALPLRQVSLTGGKYCRYATNAHRVPSRLPVMTSKGWCRASMILDAATKPAPIVGMITTNIFHTSPLESQMCSFAAKYNER